MGCCTSRPQDSPPDSLSVGPGQDAASAVPHKFDEIIANEKSTSTTDALLDQAYSSGILLAEKTKKYWVDKNTKFNSFMLYPRGLSITWGEDSRYWEWQTFEEASDTGIEVAYLKNVCWLDIQGKQELSHLTPGVNYEVFFEVRLHESAEGWSVPVTLLLKFPNGTVCSREEKLQEKPKGRWLELKVGDVKAQQGQKGKLEISMTRHGGEWKRGLLLKGIKITPKKP